jgi:hypothetical protein
MEQLIACTVLLNNYLLNDNKLFYVSSFDELYNKIIIKNERHITFEEYTMIIFRQEEIDKINKSFPKNDTQLKQIISAKYIGLVNLKEYMSMILAYYKFIQRKSLNPRGLKSYLREANMAQKDFMLYTYEMFEKSSEYIALEDELYSANGAMGFKEWTTIGDCLELAFFDYYISKFGNNFNGTDVTGSIIFFYGDRIVIAKDCAVVCLFEEQDGCIQMIDKDKYNSDEIEKITNLVKQIIKESDFK